MTSNAKINRASLLLAAALTVGIAATAQACVLPQVVGQNAAHPTPCGHGLQTGQAGAINPPAHFGGGLGLGGGTITVPGTNTGLGDGDLNSGGGGTGGGGKCLGTIDGYCYAVQ
jgi:hypothetical protein